MRFGSPVQTFATKSARFCREHVQRSAVTEVPPQSLNHLIGLQQDRLRNRKPKRLSCLEKFNWVTPVILRPGRFKLATRPGLIGSPAVSKTIGMVAVAAWAARAADVVVAAITVTCWRAKSATSPGS
jgi:hypothetical protein